MDFLRFCVLAIILVSGAVNGQMFPVNSVTEGGTTTLTCDARKAIGSKTGQFDYNQIQHVNSLSILKHDQPDPLAVYALVGIDDQLIVSPAVNQQTHVVKNGGLLDSQASVVGNQNTAFISMEIKSVNCRDEGMYTCKATIYYQDLSSAQPETTANLTIPHLTGEIASKLNLDNPSYDRNFNLSISCRASGSDGITVKWEYRECESNSGSNPALNNNNLRFRPWVDQNEIVNKDLVEKPQAGCVSKYEIDSTLTTRPLGFYDPSICAIRCLVGVFEGGQFVEHKNFNKTFTLNGPGNNPGAATAGGGGDDVGMIVGIVIGLLALIALVIVLIYIFVFRRRRNKDQEGDYPDTRDKGDVDPNMTAAPPVFYTKPEKGPRDDRDNTVIGVHNDALDTSYDSKDSASRGPPRYANTPDVDSNGPPRYEKEKGRGRPNKGYDEENGDHGHRYGRNDDGRRDRDRDHYDNRRDRYDDRQPEDDRRYSRRDDAPRSRRYSTEDGTDENAVNFNYGGDPNMGTAI